MKKTAFTLAEMIIVMIIVGFLIALLIKAVNSLDINKKQNVTTIYKIMDDFTQISLRTLNQDTKHFPTGTYIQEAVGNWQYVAVNDENQPATASDIIKYLAKNARFKKIGINFCSNSDCKVLGLEGETISGAKMFSDAYIGILLNHDVANSNGTGITDCPQYYMPDVEGAITPSGSYKCWAKLLVDTNGKKNPNVLGEDIYVFGINESVLAK